MKTISKEEKLELIEKAKVDMVSDEIIEFFKNYQKNMIEHMNHTPSDVKCWHHLDTTNNKYTDEIRFSCKIEDGRIWKSEHHVEEVKTRYLMEKMKKK